MITLAKKTIKNEWNAEMKATKNLTELEEALQQLLEYCLPVTETQQLTLGEADHRVLAQDVCSSLSVPGFDNSAMDGYALNSSGVSAQDIEQGRRFTVFERIAAGSVGEQLPAGALARIFTGAPVPPGADSVIPQEKTQLKPDGLVVLLQKPMAGDNVRRIGEDIEKGATILQRGDRLGPAQIGVAASVGIPALTVYRKPRVALFVTGDELTQPGEALQPGGIYNSNCFVLHNLLQRMACDVSDMGILRDSLGQVKTALIEAAQGHDLILTSGGVSVGEEDHVKQAVMDLGELKLWRLAIKPGKPLAYGQLKRSDGSYCHFIGLPGNPVASFVTFLLVVQPFLQKLSGGVQQKIHALMRPASFQAKTKERREFLRARINTGGEVEIYPNQSSGVLTSMAWAHGLVDIPAQAEVNFGDQVRYIPFSDLGL